MMSGSITAWLNLLRDGNELAAEKLWDYFAPNLRGRIAPQCRDLKICDEDDIAVTAFYRLISVMQDDDRYPVTDRKEFWRLLVVISKNMIGDWRKYDNAKCRGGEVQILPFHSADQQPTSGDFRQFEFQNEFELVAQLREMARMMDRAEYLDVIEYKQHGLTNEEVAKEIGFSVRTVQYIIRDIKEAWFATFEQRRVA